MRVAVCVSGEMRGNPHWPNSLHFHVMDPFKKRGDKVDLFVHTRRDRWSHTALDVSARLICVEEFRPLPTSVIVSEVNPKSRGDYEGDSRGYLYQSYLQMYWGMARVGKMLIQTEQQEGRYDLVVWTRPDIFLRGELPVGDFRPGKVYVPGNDWWPYEVDGRRVETCCDKLAVGSSTDMQLYMNKLKQLRGFCERYVIHGEAFCAWCLAGERFLREGELPWVRHGGIVIDQCEDAHHNCDRPGRLGCSTL